MKMMPKEFNPYLGLALIFISVLPLAHEIARIAESGIVRPMMIVFLGVFLLLGIVLVVENFVYRRLLWCLLFLLGTCFWSLMAYVVLAKMAPHLASRLGIVLPAGAVATGVHYLYLKWCGGIRLEPDETRRMRHRTIVAADRIKPANKARNASPAAKPDSTHRDDAAPE